MYIYIYIYMSISYIINMRMHVHIYMVMRHCCWFQAKSLFQGGASTWSWTLLEESVSRLLEESVASITLDSFIVFPCVLFSYFGAMQ